VRYDMQPEDVRRPRSRTNLSICPILGKKFDLIIVNYAQRRHWSDHGQHSRRAVLRAAEGPSIMQRESGEATEASRGGTLIVSAITAIGRDGRIPSPMRATPNTPSAPLLWSPW